MHLVNVKSVNRVKSINGVKAVSYPCRSGVTELPRESVALHLVRKLQERVFLSWLMHW